MGSFSLGQTSDMMPAGPVPAKTSTYPQDRLQGKQRRLLASCSGGTAPVGCSTDFTFFQIISLYYHFENTKYSSYVSGPQSQELLPEADEFSSVDVARHTLHLSWTRSWMYSFLSEYQNFRKRGSYWLLTNLECLVWVFTFCNHERDMQFIMHMFKYRTGGCLSETYTLSKSLYLKDLSFGRDSAYGG